MTCERPGRALRVPKSGDLAGDYFLLDLVSRDSHCSVLSNVSVISAKPGSLSEHRNLSSRRIRERSLGRRGAGGL